jgi:hypothetical protein
MAQDWLETLRKKQQRANQLRDELAEIERELRDAKAILTGRSIVPDTERPKSRHGFTGGKRAKPIQEGSSVWWTQKVLTDAGAPMHIDAIITHIKERGGPVVQKATLASNLSRYVTHGDTFDRPGPNVFGLIQASEPEEGF